MLDINSIKEKINEVTQLAESSHSSTAISLFNMLKKDSAIQEIYDEFCGDNFEGDLLDRCDEYVEDETYRLDKAYQDMDWIRVNGLYFNWEEIWSDWKDYCENLDKPKVPEDSGKEWLEEEFDSYDVETIKSQLVVKLREFTELYQSLMETNGEDAADSEDFVDYANRIVAVIGHLTKDYDKRDYTLDEIYNKGRSLAEDYTDYAFVEEERYDEFRNLEDYLNDVNACALMYYMYKEGRLKYATEIFQIVVKYVNDTFPSFTHEDIGKNLEQPKDTGKDWLEESTLMEMPATNYTSFEIEPYIICDTEYIGDDDEDNIYDDPDAYVTPLSEYIDNTRNNPYWVREKFNYNREKPVCLPKLNEKLDTGIVCIIGHLGYYDGMTVGIVAREWDYDVMSENFTEFGIDREGNALYTMDMLHDDSQAFTESEAEQEWTRRVLESEIDKAIQILIETQAVAGGRLYPSDMGYKAPKTSGEEFDESVIYKKENLTETVRPRELPDPSWYDESMSVGDTLSNKYMGYPIFVECCRDDDDEEERFYNLQIYLPDDKFSEEPIEEANFTYWNDMIYYLKEYVLEHPLNPNLDEPSIENEPEDKGNNWLEESTKLNENENDEFEYWRNHEPIEADTSISFDYKGFHITVDNMEGDHFNVNIYEMINQPHIRNSVYPNINYTQYEFYAYSWSRIFDGIIAYVNRCSYDEPENVQKPKKSGQEFDEVLDIKGIKKQINEIVRMSDGNN